MATFMKAIVKTDTTRTEYLVTVSDAADKSYGVLYERGMVKLHRRTNVGAHGRLEEYDKVFVDADTLEFVAGSEFQE
jgi:hypothetical protein